MIIMGRAKGRGQRERERLSCDGAGLELAKQEQLLELSIISSSVKCFLICLC